jgi:hypothetical protein
MNELLLILGVPTLLTYWGIKAANDAWRGRIESDARKEVAGLIERNANLENKIAEWKRFCDTPQEAQRFASENARWNRSYDLAVGTLLEPLTEAKLTSPAWIREPEDFLLWSLDRYRSIIDMCQRLIPLSEQISLLSADSKRVLEEAVNLRLTDECESGGGEPHQTTALMENLVDIARNWPRSLLGTIFVYRADHLNELISWLKTLESISSAHILNLWCNAELTNLRYSNKAASGLGW